jgi:hypothetical protein
MMPLTGGDGTRRGVARSDMAGFGRLEVSEGIAEDGDAVELPIAQRINGEKSKASIRNP